MNNQTISVKITDNITVEWRPSYYTKEYIKNEKYEPLVHHCWNNHQSIFDLDKHQFMDEYVIRGSYSGTDGKD